MKFDNRVGGRKALQILVGEGSLPDQTLNHTLHVSEAKWIQKRKENSTRWQ